MVKDRSGYSPWSGRTIQGWPVTVLRRGQVIVENNDIVAKAGSGRFLPRSAGAQPFTYLHPPLGHLPAG